MNCPHCQSEIESPVAEPIATCPNCGNALISPQEGEIQPSADKPVGKPKQPLAATDGPVSASHKGQPATSNFSLSRNAGLLAVVALVACVLMVSAWLAGFFNDAPCDISAEYVAGTPTPTFQPLSSPTYVPNLSAYRSTAETASAAGVRTPGAHMTVRVYTPEAYDKDGGKRLPCMFTTHQYTNLLAGPQAAELSTQYLEPYLKAGMVVVEYTVDGGPQKPDPKTLESQVQQYNEYRRAAAGVVNGRNAVEFALSHLKGVDPDKLFAVGFDTGGTQALLLAANEPRIAACAVYGAAFDVENLLRPLLQETWVKENFAQVENFARQSSPTNQTAKFKCPVFVYHARFDKVAPFSDAEEFCRKLNASGGSAEIVVDNDAQSLHIHRTAFSKGHPSAVRWLSDVADTTQQ